MFIQFYNDKQLFFFFVFTWLIDLFEHTFYFANFLKVIRLLNKYLKDYLLAKKLWKNKKVHINMQWTRFSNLKT